MPLTTVAGTVFDIQVLLEAAYADGATPLVPAGKEADRPARGIQVLRDEVTGDNVLRVTFADGTGVGIKLHQRLVADVAKALSGP